MRASAYKQRNLGIGGEEGLRRGENADANAAFIIDSSFTVAWALMPGVFERAGFAIDDLNQSEGTYYTSYEARWQTGAYSVA